MYMVLCYHGNHYHLAFRRVLDSHQVRATAYKCLLWCYCHIGDSLVRFVRSCFLANRSKVKLAVAKSIIFIILYLNFVVEQKYIHVKIKDDLCNCTKKTFRENIKKFKPIKQMILNPCKRKCYLYIHKKSINSSG